MYSFEGNHRAKRHVDLGRKRQENKEALLHKAIEERRAREVSRRRDDAARRLQTQWKRYRQATAISDEIRILIDNLVEEGHVFQAMLALAHVYRRARGDAGRLERLCKLLQADRARHGGAYSWELLPSDHVPSRTLRRFAGLAVGKTVDVDDIDGQQACLKTAYDIVRKFGATIDVSYYGALLELPSTIPGWDEAFVTPLSSTEPSVFMDFCLNGLTHYDLSRMGREFWHRCNVNLLLHVGSELQASSGLTDHELVSALVGLASLSQSMQGRISPQTAESFLSLCTSVLDEVYDRLRKLAVAASEAESGDDDDLDDDEGRENQARMDSNDSLLHKVFSHFPTELKNALEILSSSSALGMLFVALDKDSLGTVCRFSKILINVCYWRKSSLLVLLAKERGPNGVNLLRLTWDRISSSRLAVSPAKETAREYTSALPGEDQQILELFSMVYSRALLTMIDDEFYDPSRNVLNMYEVIRLTEILKAVLVAMYLDVTIPVADAAATSRFLASRGVYTELIQQLFRRDSRRRYTPNGHWLMGERINFESFVTAVVSEARKMDLEGVHVSPRALNSVSANTSLSRLAILNECPFFVPFKARYSILQQLISLDRERRGFANLWHTDRHKAVIRRTNVFEDGFDNFHGLGSLFKADTDITFIDETGQAELGIDGGGLTKEFLTSICKEVFHADYGLFVETVDNLLYPNPQSFNQDAKTLQFYEFMGMLIGKCIYSGILVDAQFAPFFVLKWLGRAGYVDDLASMDPELYRGLVYLKHYEGDDVESVFSLNFTVTIEEMSASKSIDLVPNGSEIPVTSENKLQYIHLVSNYHLNTRLAKQSAAFVKGLAKLVDLTWLSTFNQQELQSLVSGATVSIDLDDMEANTLFYGFEGPSSHTKDDFWAVLREFNEEQRRDLLKFITSIAKPPIMGFKALNPQIAVRCDDEDQHRLPTASTCVNLLKLPPYKDRATLKAKLLRAISENTGFGFN